MMMTKSISISAQPKKTSFKKQSWMKIQQLLSKYRRWSLIRKAMPTIRIQKKKISRTNLDKKDVSVSRLLGAGGFGSVYLGDYKNETVAVKIMRKHCKNPAAQVESFKAELNVLHFEHPNIVKTIVATSVEQFDEGAWIVMEYVGSKTLQTIINTTELCQETRIKYALQMASALKYTHEKHVIHLDIKPANILITATHDVKIGDFGCSQRVESDTGLISPTQRSHLTGTFAYRAPELLKGQPPTKKADIYSMGITLWQMLTREKPYGNENQHVVIFSVVAYGQRPQHPQIETDPFEDCYRDLYTQCWSAMEQERPSAGELHDILQIWRRYM